MSTTCRRLPPCGLGPRRGRTYLHPRGWGSDDAERAGREIAEVARVPPPRVHLPVWPFWTAGAICEALCAPFGLEPPHLSPARGLLHEEPRVRHHARARQSWVRAAVRISRRHAADARLLPQGRVAVSANRDSRARRISRSGARIGARQVLAAHRRATRVGALLEYELVQLLSQWVPGALGLVLRKRLYRCSSAPVGETWSSVRVSC